MISRANSQQVCFELKSPALLIKGGTCPADELLLYQIPMDEDDSWRLCGCCFTTHKKKLSKPSPNHCRCSGLRIEFRLHLQPTPTSHPPRKFCRWSLETALSRALGPQQRSSWGLSVAICKHARASLWCRNPGGCQLSRNTKSRRALHRSGLGTGNRHQWRDTGRIRSFWTLAPLGLACGNPV